MTGKEIPFLLLRLQVKAPKTGKWIDIWPAQFEHFHKLGCEIRIVELSPGEPPISPQHAAELKAEIHQLRIDNARLRDEAAIHKIRRRE